MRSDDRRLLLVCPTSGKLIDTGVRLDPESLRSYVPRNGRSFCTYCAREHAWRKEGLVLEISPDD